MTDVYCSGKYRGTVSDNEDPDRIGRVKAKVLDIETGWALPNVPYAGIGVGLYLIPPVGSWVWIEFELGNLENPIWTGCFWEKGTLPPEATSPDVKVLKTDKGKITINDFSGEIVIEQISTGTVKMVMNGEEIELTFGKDASVKLNSGQILINKGTSKIEINDSKITLTVGKGSVQVSATNVLINDGALEVT